VLDSALDAGHPLTLAGPGARRHVVAEWNGAGDAQWRDRLTRRMTERAGVLRRQVEGSLNERKVADFKRASEIYTAFRASLGQALSRLRARDIQQEAMLWADEDQRQLRRDIERMEQRVESLDDEERRELAGIEDRYADVRPYIASVGLVFALSKADSDEWEAA
jgi:hypothetical protein